MSDADQQPLELQPLPHPELFEYEPELTEPEAPEPAPAPTPAAPAQSEAPSPQPPSSERPRWQRFLYGVLAFVLYASLINIAAEAVLQGTSIRWWVLGSVGGFLALSLLLWRRTGWPMKAGLATLVLLGLLAFSAWFATDPAQGVTLALQPPTVVLSAVTALMVATAGLSLLRLRALPWWDKFLIGLVASYGAAAFIVPLVMPAPAPSLFGAEGFWDPLPFWLQGEFIGVLVLLPLTLLALLITGLLRVRGRKLWGRGFQILAFALTLLLAWGAFTSAAVPAPEAPPEETTPALPEPAPPDAPAPGTPST